MIGIQLESGYESSYSRDTFTRIMGKKPSLSDTTLLKATWLDTPLGPMIAIADDDALCVLEFIEKSNLENKIRKLQQKLNCNIIQGNSAPLESIENELNLYFSGKLMQFKTPLRLIGSDFQKNVWKELIKIPYGETCSYLDLAKAVGNPLACRAVARANGSNQMPIIIPCHRVINNNGKLGGYSSGISRKQWLIDHEKKHK